MSTPTRLTAHSLRAGMATSAAAGGASQRDTMQLRPHRSIEVVRRSIRADKRFHKGSAARFTSPCAPVAPAHVSQWIFGLRVQRQQPGNMRRRRFALAGT